MIRVLCTAAALVLASIDLLGFTEARGVVTASWKVRLCGSEPTVEMTARLWQESLVIDTIFRDGSARGLSYGAIRGVAQPELLLLPHLTYGSHHLNVEDSKFKQPFQCAAGRRRAETGYWRSNGAEASAPWPLTSGIPEASEQVCLLKAPYTGWEAVANRLERKIPTDHRQRCDQGSLYVMQGLATPRDRGIPP